MSATSRKRRQERSLNSLQEAQKRALGLKEDVHELHCALSESGGKLRDSEDGQEMTCRCVNDAQSSILGVLKQWIEWEK